MNFNGISKPACSTIFPLGFLGSSNRKVLRFHFIPRRCEGTKLFIIRVTHVENFLSQIATFSQVTSLYLNVTEVKQMISYFYNNFYPVMSYRRVQKKKKATDYCIRFGHSLWSANQLPAQGVKKSRRFNFMRGSCLKLLFLLFLSLFLSLSLSLSLCHWN